MTVFALRRDVGAFEDRAFDVLVVGGGVVGACIARDAARRGLLVALVEANDFCSATSEAMSHLVHGGIRYLSHGHFGHLRQSLAERASWKRIAPHQVVLQPCLVPLVGKPLLARLAMRAGLALFNAMGGRNIVPIGMLTPPYLDAAATVAAEPLLAMPGLEGALCYHDCRIDEPERIVLGLIKDAAHHGAVVANHVECTRLLVENSRVVGAMVLDRIGGSTGLIRAGVVVNATGAWSGLLASRLLPGQKSARLTQSKGIHIVTGPLATRHAFGLSGHGEHAAVLPWRGYSLIGTTDDRFEGDPADVSILPEDEDRLIAKIVRLLPSASPVMGTIHARFASLRALPGSTQDTYAAARDCAIVHHAGDGAAGFMSVFGGKWTTARKMAEDAVDALRPLVARAMRRCDTATAVLAEAPTEGIDACLAHWGRMLPSWSVADIHAWVSAYGTAMPGVVEFLSRPDAATDDERERARFAYAVANEMAIGPEDVARRLARWYGIERPGVTARAAAWLDETSRAGQGTA